MPNTEVQFNFKYNQIL